MTDNSFIRLLVGQFIVAIASPERRYFVTTTTMCAASTPAVTISLGSSFRRDSHRSRPAQTKRPARNHSTLDSVFGYQGEIDSYVIWGPPCVQTSDCDNHHHTKCVYCDSHLKCETGRGTCEPHHGKQMTRTPMQCFVELCDGWPSPPSRPKN